MQTLSNEVASNHLRFKTLSPQDVLGELVRRKLKFGKKQASAAGWVLHFTAGYLLVLFNRSLSAKKELPDVKHSGLTYGFLDGILALIIWKLTLRFHPNPPDMKLKDYFLQLFVAHLFFGLTQQISRSLHKR